MVEISIIFVSPKYSGNIGSLARVMKNFNFKEMVIVNPKCRIDDESYKYAMHGSDILENARIVDSLDEVLNELKLSIGTSAISTKTENNFLRIPKTPEEIAEHIKNIDGKIGIFFGREDIGLLNEELEKMDLFLTVPANPEYPVMNITHSAAIIFYVLYKNISRDERRINHAKKHELDLLYERITEIIDLTDYPEIKKKNNYRMLKRIIGRSGITEWEYHILMGMLSEIRRKMENTHL
ncbi:MAG: RNA methyltransferase [Thermoplasmata archaeon]